MLTNGKGFYHPLVYVLECHRLGLKLLPPSVNEPGPRFRPHGNSFACRLTRVKGLHHAHDRIAMLRRPESRAFNSMADFFQRVGPIGEELEAMIRVGAFDEFGETRTRQFWQAQHLLKTFGSGTKRSKAGSFHSRP